MNSRFDPRSLIWQSLLLFLLASCSSISSPTPSRGPNHDYQLYRTLSDNCGEISSETSDRVIRFLSEHLIASTSRVVALRYPIKIKLVACKEPIAFSLGAGSIIISHGLINKLPLEAQLAFVIAHELGHEALRHIEQSLQKDGSDSPSITARRMEQEADSYALKIMIIAGYDPSASITTIEALMNSQRSDLAHGGYPSLESRRETLRHLITAAQWQGPGILSRRDYAKLRAEILQNH